MINQLLSSQFLVAFLIIVNVFLILVLWLVVRRVSRLHGDMEAASTISSVSNSCESMQTSENAKSAIGKSAEILKMLETLVVDAKSAADNFEEQIQEKRHLSKTLNDALDSRIISINLLLSRAKTLHEKLEVQQDKIIEQAGNLRTHAVAHAQTPQASRANVIDQQQQIIDMFYRKKDVDSIAQALSLPKEEVRMVIELKEKFLAMEKTK